MKRNIRVLLIILAVLAIAGGTFAFAAANSVPQSNVGYGESAISGFTVTNIEYIPATDMDEITNITFTLNKPATTVKINTSATEGGVWDTWTCYPTLTFDNGHIANGTMVGCNGVQNTADVVKLNVYASDQLELQATYAP